MAVEEEVLEPGEQAVVGWRFDQIIALGVDADTAEWLANGTTDWHELERLLKRGCPLPLAIELLT